MRLFLLLLGYVTSTLYIIIFIIITSTSDLQPSTAISNPSPGKSILNKFKPY